MRHSVSEVDPEKHAHSLEPGVPTAVAAGRAWIRRSIWTLVDQVAFSGSNLLLSILLARWLEPAAYGAFAIAFAIFLLIGAVHSTIVVEPMLVFGPVRYGADFGGYFRGLLRLHWRLSAVLVGIAAVAAVTAGARADRPLAILIGGVALAMPCVLLVWLVRRAFYVVDDIPRGAFGSATYALVLVLQLLGLRAAGLLSPAAAFAALAGAGLLSGLVSIRSLNLRAQHGLSAHQVLEAHLPYSKWALASALFMWVPANAIVVILPVFAGLESTAALRAALNVVTPAQTAWTALGLMLMPSLVRAGRRADTHLIRRWILVCGLVGALAWYLLAVYHRQLFHVLYDDRYAAYSHVLVILGAFPLLVGFEILLEILHRSRERSRRIFAAWVLASATVIPATVIALKWYGARAAATGIVLTYAACGALLSGPLLRRTTHDPNSLRVDEP